MGEAAIFSTTVLGWALGAVLGQLLSDLMTARRSVPFDAEAFTIELRSLHHAKVREIKRDLLYSMTEPTHG